MLNRTAQYLDVDLWSPSFAENPYPTYKLLREKHPVCRIKNGAYVLSRYDDVKCALKNNQVFSSGWPHSPFGRPDWLQEDLQRGLFLADVDPPAHSQHNAIINKLFVSKVVDSLTPLTQKTAQQLVESIKQRQRNDAEFLKDFAYPLVEFVISQITGLTPDNEVERTQRWVKTARTLPIECPHLEKKLEIEQTIDDQNSYYDRVIENRRAHPRSDLAGLIANATIDGDHLTSKQARAALSLFTIGGFEAPAQMLARAIILLSQREDLKELLRKDPDKTQFFVEELIRMGSASQGSLRLTTTEVTLHETTIPAGSLVLALIGAANRDPDQFPSPDTFQLTRPNIRSHLGFGQGVHVCIGAAVARMEIKIGLETFLNAFPNFTCSTTKGLDWQSLVMLHILSALPIRLH